VVAAACAALAATAGCQTGTRASSAARPSSDATIAGDTTPDTASTAAGTPAAAAPPASDAVTGAGPDAGATGAPSRPRAGREALPPLDSSRGSPPAPVATAASEQTSGALAAAGSPRPVARPSTAPRRIAPARSTTPASRATAIVVERNTLVDPISPASALLQEPRAALRHLPLDRLGRVDWAAALRDGDIAPRARLDGPGAMEIREDVVVMRGTRSMPWVHFPHGTHTQWLACSNCHPRPFEPRAGASRFTMDDMYRGEGCGMCHDRVAFSTFACERCHVEPHEGSPRAWW
jgi:c(7)-type cytochrome triheme protein